MGGGPPRFPRASTSRAVLAHRPTRGVGFRRRGSHPLWPAVPGRSPTHTTRRAAPGRGPWPAAQPPPDNACRLGIWGVWAAPRSLAATRGILSVPRGTEMFQFPHLPPPGLCVQPGVMGHHAHRVAPFGHRRRIACLRPTVAFRSLPRPSSAPVAEASSADRPSLERDRISPTSVSGSSERDSSTRRS